ncbi:MAG: FmdB family zinc ribbon protein [Planctomycetota bacterium]
MPTYDYVCDACGHAFEEFQSMTAKVLKKCPACGKMKLRRLIGTGAGVIFKGGGFYETDYRSESYQKDAKADKPAETKSDSKSGDTKKAESKSSESKPKTEAKKPATKKDTGS